MKYKDIAGIKYIADELKRNSTSNRAIIPLLRLENVIELQFSYLPGLNSIQFGFLNDEKKQLICTMYLRSLEVNHFLRINLSEIYLLISQLQEEIRSITSVVINLFAFKAQYKEKFSCFKKALIDICPPEELNYSIYNREIGKLVDFVRDKFEMQETVVNVQGLTQLYKNMKCSTLYSADCIKKLHAVIEAMNELDSEYRKNSDYSDGKIENLEKIISEKQSEFLSVFEKLIE